MAKRAWIVGADAIMDWYSDNHTTPYYSVWNGKVKKFCWTKDDEEKGEEFLRRTLEVAESAGLTDILTLRLNTELTGKDINDRTPYNIEIEFACAGSGIAGVSGNQQNQQFYRENFNSKSERILAAIGELATNQKLLQDQVSAMQTQKLLEDAEADDDGGEDESLQGILKGYLADPQVKQFIIGSVGKLFGGGKMGAMAGPGEVTDTLSKTDAELLHGAISRLKKVNNRLGADLYILANIADKNPDLFKDILGQLRGMEGMFK